MIVSNTVAFCMLPNCLWILFLIQISAITFGKYSGSEQCANSCILTKMKYRHHDIFYKVYFASRSKWLYIVFCKDIKLLHFFLFSQPGEG